MARRPARIRAAFGVRVAQGANPSNTFAATDALRPHLTGNENMWRVFEPDLRRRLSELDATATTVERVREVLLELLPGNATTNEKTSVRLGMSKRTLQRHLEGQGESFRALINATRENPADRYLTKTNLSGGEIVSLLGFDDPDAFYRALQDWTGQTPDSARPAMRLN